MAGNSQMIGPACSMIPVLQLGSKVLGQLQAFVLWIGANETPACPGFRGAPTKKDGLHMQSVLVASALGCECPCLLSLHVALAPELVLQDQAEHDAHDADDQASQEQRSPALDRQSQAERVPDPFCDLEHDHVDDQREQP